MIEWAKTNNGDIIDIFHADKSLHSPFMCVECGDQLIAKNREFDGRIKMFHFAHKSETGGCGGGESEHHYNVKCFYYHMLKTNIDEGIGYDGYTATRSALSRYDFNILNGIDEISIEKNTIGKLIPDISLMSCGKLIRVIEIIYKHEDSAVKTSFYMRNKIQVCKVYIDDETYSKIKDGHIPRIRYFDEPHRIYKTETENMFKALSRYYGERVLNAKIENEISEKTTFLIWPSSKYPNHTINFTEWILEKKKISTLSKSFAVIKKETTNAYFISFDISILNGMWIPKNQCKIQKIQKSPDGVGATI